MTVVVPDLDELVTRYVTPGSHVHLAMTTARPNAAVFALARVFAGTRSLTVSTAAVHTAAHALALSGAVERMITCFLGDTYPTPRPNALYSRVADGDPFSLELWSVLTFVQRLMAGATGAPYAATRSLWGSDLCKGKEGLLVEVPGPDGDQPVLLAKALIPDITIVHGVCADSRGNVVLAQPIGEGAWAALAAARGVLATVERIVPDSVVDEHPDHVVIPGQRVVAVCEAPHGAHPQSLRSGGIAGVVGYRDDYDHLVELAEAGRTAEGMKKWYRDWVEDTGCHERYLEKLGGARLRSLSAKAEQPAPPQISDAPTATEKAIVLGARAIRHQVRANGYNTLLAGIGPSHIAAWLAADQLRATGVEIAVCAELGYYGQRPQGGDVFLFSQHHAVQQLTGIAEVLGGMVSANRDRCLGVLGAGEVDPGGNINTCLLPDGRWITGSGGANDIASTVDCIVVAVATPRRFVRSVAHVTSPGRNVREVVSQFGRFSRDCAEQELRLATFLADEDRSPGEVVASRTSWCQPHESVDLEPDVSTEELAALRRLDPAGFYR